MVQEDNKKTSVNVVKLIDWSSVSTDASPT